MLSSTFYNSFLESQFLVQTIKEALRGSGLKTRYINCIVSDEASNCRKAREDFKKNILEHVIEYRCLAHVVNLIIASFLKPTRIYYLIQRCVSLIQGLNGNTKLTGFLKEIKAPRPISMLPTRWYSASACINSLIKLRPDLYKIPRTDPYKPQNWAHIVEDDQFWDELHIIKVYVNRLSEIIGLEERSSMNIGEGFKHLLDFGEFVMNTNQRAFIKNQAMNAFLQHFLKLDKGLMFAAYMLNPKFKCRHLTDEAISEGRVRILTILIESGQSPDITDTLVGELDNYMSSFCEFDDEAHDLSHYWSESKFLTLKLVGSRLAACESSSANTERINSGLSLIVRPDRNRLATNTIENIISIRINILSSRLEPDSVSNEPTGSKYNGVQNWPRI